MSTHHGPYLYPHLSVPDLSFGKLLSEPFIHSQSWLLSSSRDLPCIWKIIQEPYSSLAGRPLRLKLSLKPNKRNSPRPRVFTLKYSAICGSHAGHFWDPDGHRHHGDDIMAFFQWKVWFRILDYKYYRVFDELPQIFSCSPPRVWSINLPWFHQIQQQWANKHFLLTNISAYWYLILCHHSIFLFF